MKTPKDIAGMFKTAAQTELLLSQDGSVSPFVLPEDVATMRFVIDTLMPQIADLRARRIVWLRSQGLCWKSVAKEVGLTESQAKRVFAREIAALRKTRCGTEVFKIVRQEYLNKLISLKDKRIIKVVTEMRRSGKSTLFALYRDWLIRNGEYAALYQMQFKSKKERNV